MAELFKHSAKFVKNLAELLIFSQGFKSSAECFKTNTRYSVSWKEIYENLVGKKRRVSILVTP